ncbi:ferredoxin [Streptomyces sp. 891-h]|nr:ferredoxin [Streptomyces sp. 891-h]
MRVAADEEVCCGAGQCVLEAPEVFAQREEDGIVRLLDPAPPLHLRAQVEAAADLCPARALTVRPGPGARSRDDPGPSLSAPRDQFGH